MDYVTNYGLVLAQTQLELERSARIINQNLVHFPITNIAKQKRLQIFFGCNDKCV